MARPRYARPTDAELQILGILWRRGGSTVREVFKELGPIRGSGYNSTLKLMQIMHDKEYVHRDDSVRPQIYSAALTRRNTHRLLLRDLMDRVFSGASTEMISHLLALKKIHPQEAVEIKAQLETAGRGGD